MLFRSVKNFTYEKNERFYKDQKVNEIIQKLDSGEYDVKDFPGWNKCFGRWCYHTEDILTGDILKLQSENFTKEQVNLCFSIKQLVNIFLGKIINRNGKKIMDFIFLKCANVNNVVE